MRIRAAVPVYNEEKLLPHFLRHYGAFCDSIVVWDNRSTDRSPEIARAHPRVELRSFDTEGYDEKAVLGVLEKTKAESASKFDWILLPDCDEFIVSGAPGGVRGVLEGSKLGLLAPAGFCVIQGPLERPLDFSRGVLAQRSFGWRSLRYSKPIVMRPEAAVALCPGKHWIRYDRDPVVEPRLGLLHFEMADFDHWIYRKNRRPLSAENRRKGYSTDRFCRPVEELRGLWDRCMAQAGDIQPDLLALGVRFS